MCLVRLAIHGGDYRLFARSGIRSDTLIYRWFHCVEQAMSDAVDVDLGSAVVAFRPAAGVKRSIPAGDVSPTVLFHAAPWRTFRWYLGQRHYSGTYWSATQHDHVIYESRLELANPCAKASSAASWRETSTSVSSSSSSTPSSTRRTATTCSSGTPPRSTGAHGNRPPPYRRPALNARARPLQVQLPTLLVPNFRAVVTRGAVGGWQWSRAT